MSISSMTGFGRGVAGAAGITAQVELNAVNRKQFDCQINLPRDLFSLESQVLFMVKAALARGHIKVFIAVQYDDNSPVSHGELAAWRRRIATIRHAAEVLRLPDDLAASALLRLDVAAEGAPPAERCAAAWCAVEPALAAALADLQAMRRREGVAIQADLAMRFAALQDVATEISQLAPAVPNHYRERLRLRIDKVLAEQKLALDPNALAHEVALFADRCDISEELTRLNSHFAQAIELLASSTPCGRQLDFLCQEFLREINTIGSKANDTPITRCVIAFKTGLEAIREQVQNVE